MFVERPSAHAHTCTLTVCDERVPTHRQEMMGADGEFERRRLELTHLNNLSWTQVRDSLSTKNLNANDATDADVVRTHG